MTARLYLFDDARARQWEPFTLTRPAAELVLGALRLWERAARVWKADYGGHLAAAHLAGFREDGGPRALAVPAGGNDGHRILASSRAVVRSAPRELPPVAAGLFIDGKRIGWSLPSHTPLPHPDDFADPAAAPPARTRLDLDGFVLENPWELVERAPEQLRDDLASGAVTASDPTGAAAGGEALRKSLSGAHVESEAVSDARTPELGRGAALPSGVHHIGDGILALGTGASVEPGVVLDTRPGPIVLGDGVRVRGPARLEGPLYAARGTTVLGGRVSASYIGPACKIRGEVEGCVFLGYDNKAHDGFLGHAYLGRWVNLGALTTNSDLRSDYRDVRVRIGAGAVSSGLTKLGCFVGDHVKTGIGTLLNTGAVVGAGCNVFGGRAPTDYLPPFRWGASHDAPDFRLDRFLDTAARAMGRRGVPLTPELRGVLERAWARACLRA